MYLWYQLFRKFPERFSGKFPERSVIPEQRSGNFRFTEKKSFRNSGTFSIMEMEKISGSFPYVNRNPEFRWKPYCRLRKDRDESINLDFQDSRVSSSG